jgi:hypothetical protein
MKECAMKATSDTTRRHIPANWLASYRLERSDEAGWRDANLVGLSDYGATLALHGLTTRSEVLDGPLDLQLATLLGSSDGIYLRGEIRHVTGMSTHRVLVDIEFIDLNVEAAQLLELLIDLV